MKVTIERSALSKALGHVQSVVERRNTIPILSNVLIQAQKHSLVLTATDLDIEISEEAPADVAQDGATTVSALTLFEIVKRLPDGAQVRLDLSREEGRLQVSAGRSEFSLAVLPDDDFPSLSHDDLDTKFTMATSDLRRLLQKTRFAMSQEETRYYLNGVYFHACPEEDTPLLRAAATDGHRLARLDAPLPDGAGNMPGVIVPRKAIAELSRLLEDAEDNVEIGVSTSKIRFGFGPGRLTSKLIDGTFPDYERVIPKGNKNTLRVETKEFAQAVDRVSTVSADRTRSVKLALESDNLRLAVNNPEAGSALEELSVDYGGDPIEIGFNARYLLDVAQQVDGDTATFHLADPSSPTVIVDDEDTRALYVLMPLRV
ncbi:MAG: DNA polymerase III subunit beta [Marinicaulis sp.]|nr:DNA polymerase III subunit beta [Marinicaulis sp.]NNL89304.1 DNA polymerase III subunit beta [Marinicaulis sp.]